MATYKGINGFAVQSVATDPSPLDEGQVWYNNATYAFKLATLTTAGTFSSGGNMGTARYGMGGAGTQTATIIFGGGPDSTPFSNATELYNGTSWTTTPATLNTARTYGGPAGSGTQTAALFFGGRNPPNTPTTATESYNGTSWTTVNSLNVAGRGVGGAGTQTAALAFGRFSPPYVNSTELWNGTSWTANPTGLGTTRYNVGFAGLSTTALSFGGELPSGNNSAATESFNGSSWTTVNSLNTGRRAFAGFGTQTAAVGAGGTSPQTSATELWNGTSWTNNPTGLTTPRSNTRGSGNQTTGIVFGGSAPAASAATEEWTGPGSPVTKTITTS